MHLSSILWCRGCAKILSTSVAIGTLSPFLVIKLLSSSSGYSQYSTEDVTSIPGQSYISLIRIDLRAGPATHGPEWHTPKYPTSDPSSTRSLAGVLPVASQSFP